MPVKTIGTKEKIGDTPNSYLYAGEQRDSNLGLDYLRARYLDVETGRFVSRDSFEGILRDPGTLHKYLYGNGNPVNRTEPSGLFSLSSPQLPNLLLSQLGRVA